MNDAQISAFVGALAPVIKNFLNEATAPLAKRLARLEALVQAKELGAEDDAVKKGLNAR